MRKTVIFLVIGFIICSFVSAGYSYITYSNPTHDDGSEINWTINISPEPTKIEISKEEWNNIFEDYRDGEISKKEAVELIKEVKIKW